MRKLSTALGVAVFGLVLAVAPAAGARDARSTPPQPAPLARAAAAVTGGEAAAAAAAAQPQTQNVTVLGMSDLGGGGFNADVYGFKGYAYVGVWSGPACPATGVKVVDISDLANPTMVSVLQNPAGTSAEDVVVRHVSTPSFTGDLAVTGLQACDIFDESVQRGLQLFDVTDPTSPVELGIWELPAPLIGCHEMDLRVTKSGQVLAACASSFAVALGADFLGHPQAEVYIVDVSDPSAPQTLGRYGFLDNFVGVGCFQAQFAHSVRFYSDTVLYVSYWDAGVHRLNIRNPARPRLVSALDTVPPDEDGDVHSVAFDYERDLLYVNPEDFSPLDEEVGFCEGDFDGWGDLQIYDNSNPANPVFLSQFATENAASERTDGIYTVHNTEVFRPTQIASSWYSDGVRIIDVADPSNPTEFGFFVPPPTADPQGFFPPVPLVWGVWPISHGVLLASDINSGLWILHVDAAE